MTPFDWAVVGVVGFFVLMGLWKGLSEQAAGLLRIVLGLTAAAPLSYVLAPHLKDHQFLAWGAAYLVIWVGSYVVAKIYQESIEDDEELLFTDRLMGGFVGGLKGMLVVMFLSFIVVSNSSWARDKVLETRSGKVIATSLHAVDFLLPPDAHDKLHPYLHHLDPEGEGEHEGEGEAQPAGSPEQPDQDPAPPGASGLQPGTGAADTDGTDGQGPSDSGDGGG